MEVALPIMDDMDAAVLPLIPATASTSGGSSATVCLVTIIRSVRFWPPKLFCLFLSDFQIEHVQILRPRDGLVRNPTDLAETQTILPQPA